MIANYPESFFEVIDVVISRKNESAGFDVTIQTYTQVLLCYLEDI